MRNELCFCGSGKKTKKCHRDIHPESAFGQIALLYQKVDQKIEQDMGNVRCKKGCFSCCYEHFSISPVEFYYLMNDIIQSHGLEKAEELIQKGHETWMNFEKENPQLAGDLKMNIGSNPLKAWDDLQLMCKTSDEVSLYNKVPCPFLDDDTKACSIYHARPYVCRTYGVSYEKKQTVPFMMCEHIPDGLEYQDEMADVGEFANEAFELSTVPIHSGQQVIIERRYPLFYFLKIQYQKTDVLLRKINDFKTNSLKKVVEMRVERAMNRN